MQAVRKVRPGEGNVELCEVEPTAPGAGEVVVAVHSAGVCGTDLHIMADHYPTDPPVTLGHEVSGRVAEVGDGVDPAWRDTDVVCETFFHTCGTCVYCSAGSPNLCAERLSIGSHVDGGMAETVIVPARNLHRIPDGIDVRAAALSEPLSAVCNALCDPTLVEPGDRALVIGPGPMGLLAAQVARASGAAVTVVGTEHDGSRLDTAADLGFETLAVPLDEDVELGFDIAIDCAGAAAAATLAFTATRKRGRYSRIGVSGGDVTVPLDQVCYRELTITSGFATTPTSWRRALRLMARGDVQLDALVTEAVPLADWQRVFDACRAGDGVKYVFDPRLP